VVGPQEVFRAATLPARDLVSGSQTRCPLAGIAQEGGAVLLNTAAHFEVCAMNTNDVEFFSSPEHTWAPTLPTIFSTGSEASNLVAILLAPLRPLSHPMVFLSFVRRLRSL